MSRRKRTTNKPPLPGGNTEPENKEPVNISLRLAPALAQKVEKYSSVNGVSKNGVISIAIAEYFADRC